MDCGFPALPEATIIDKYKKRYKEFDSISYECEQKEQQILVGDKTLTCVEGKWTGKLPKCGIEMILRLQLFHKLKYSFESI